MSDTNDDETAALLELLISSLARIDALGKLLIDKGIIDEEEFLHKITEDQATYRTMFKSKH